VSDVAAVYTLATPGPDIVFNDFELFSEDDGYWLNVAPFDEPDLRVPVFNAPVTHGSRVLPGFFTGMVGSFVGEYVVQSTRIQEEINRIRNTMRRNLRSALRAIIDADGTVTWTEAVVGDDISMSLTVRYREKLVTGFESDFAQSTFAFSLVSEADEPTES
jgi:hypothetical protein